MQKTFDQLGEFYRNFPMFEQYMSLFSNNARIRYILQDLYEIYSDFCMHTIRYMGKGTLGKFGTTLSLPALILKRVMILAHILSNVFSSGYHRSVSATLKKWKDTKSDFEEHTRLAFRTQMIGVVSPTKPTETPKTTNMPRLQTYFTGRNEFLKKLHDFLSEGEWQAGSEPKSCLIHAMGGMGKTQAALAYSCWFEKHYDYRLWVRAETPERLTESFNSIVNLLNIDQGKTDSFNAVKYWMETTGTLNAFVSLI